MGDGDGVMGGLDRNLSFIIAGKRIKAKKLRYQVPCRTRYQVPVVGPGCTFSVVNGRSSTIPPMPHECSIHTQN